jgi:hypothetical protein
MRKNKVITLQEVQKEQNVIVWWSFFETIERFLTLFTKGVVGTQNIMNDLDQLILVHLEEEQERYL